MDNYAQSDQYCSDWYQERIKKTKKKVLNSILILLVYAFLYLLSMPGILFSQEYGGGYSEAYLKRDVGARAISMAGAYTAVVNEPMAVFYNPAGLAYFSDKAMFSSSYSFLEYGRKQGAIAWGQSIYPNLGIGFGINSYSSGSFQGRDIMGNPIGKLDDVSFMMNTSAAYKIDYASAGVSFKYLTNALTGSNYAADGFAVDLGMKFNIFNMFSFAVAAQNITGQMFWNFEDYDKAEAIPYTIRTGLAMEFGLNDESYETRDVSGDIITEYIPASRYVLVSLDWTYTQYDLSPKLILGSEAVLHEMIAFRAGLCLYENDEGIASLLPLNTWGFGVSLRPEIPELPFTVNFDYSLSDDKISQSGVAHSLSLIIQL